MSERTAIVELRDVSFGYDGNFILEEVNLTVDRGEFLAVIGPNGGGKTTMLKLILGLLEPAGGFIRVFGRTPRQASIRVGYVPQEFDRNLGFPISVRQVVCMGRLRGAGRRRFTRADHEAVERALTRVSMDGFKDRRIGTLSGGQRQRVFLARALVSEPDLLLLDEPTARIDSRGRSEFYSFLNELNKEVTIIVVSHDLMVLSTYIKSVACVNRRVHFHNAPEITKDMLEAAYHCPVELIAHGLPHRVLPSHEDKS
ncbi:metal ABC transporter ATP-binding protein [bacterium]|nr:metal ABC transporter ATP-binding protein [candidate division CSSED10-310 bacterium]